jgi:hypothetical protein
VSEPVNPDLRLLAYELGQALPSGHQLPELITLTTLTRSRWRLSEGTAGLLCPSHWPVFGFPLPVSHSLSAHRECGFVNSL